MPNYEKTFRKTTMNTAVAFAAMITSSTASVLEDGALAFTISSISITTACFATVAAILWPAYLAYQDGRIVDDPLQQEDVRRTARTWWENRG